MLACCILLLAKHTRTLIHCTSLQLLIKKQFYLKLLCMIVFTCRFCRITNLFCLMSAIDEQEAENSKKCEITQNSDSHRQLKFPKKLTWHAEQSFFYQIVPHDKQITQIPDSCKNVYRLYTRLIYHESEHNNFARKKCTWDAFVGYSLAIFLRFNTNIFLCLYSLI